MRQPSQAGLTDALREESHGISLLKGEKPVRLFRMLGYLDRYPDRRAAQVLEEGFCVSKKEANKFCIICHSRRVYRSMMG